MKQIHDLGEYNVKSMMRSKETQFHSNNSDTTPCRRGHQGIKDRVDLSVGYSRSVQVKTFTHSDLSC